MIMLQFKTKHDKEKLLEKAKKMEEYSAMIVDCLEEARAQEDDDYEYQERMYRDSRDYRGGRYSYRGMR